LILPSMFEASSNQSGSVEGRRIICQGFSGNNGFAAPGM